MNREIKFRGKRVDNGEWVYGSLIGNDVIVGDIVEVNDEWFNTEWWYKVIPGTVGQYSGLKDRTGEEIYEGDIIEFYNLETYCINPDCDAHLHGHGSYLCKKEGVVKFDDGIFGVGDDSNHPLTPLSYCGISEEMLDDMKDDTYLATNGYCIYNPTVGVKVIGNIFDNPELLKGANE